MPTRRPARTVSLSAYSGFEYVLRPREGIRDGRVALLMVDNDAMTASFDLDFIKRQQWPLVVPGAGACSCVVQAAD